MDNHDQITEFGLDTGTHVIAGYRRPGAAPVCVYVHGFRSHARGTKATALGQCAAQAGFGFVGFDLRACGRSTGSFREFTISGAVQDLLAVTDYLAPEPLVVVGSSLGGVLAVAAAPRIGARLVGLLLIAPAFGLLSHYFDRLDPAQRRDWAQQGVLRLRDEYDGGEYELDYAFYRDAQRYRHPLTIRFDCPLVIVHGERDELLPVADSLAFAAEAEAKQTSIFVVPGADHRVNEALPLLCAQLTRLCRHAAADTPGAC